MQWLMLQQEEAIDYVIATGQMRSVRTLIEKVFEMIESRLLGKAKILKRLES